MLVVIHETVHHLLYFPLWICVALGNKGVPALGTKQQNGPHGMRMEGPQDMCGTAKHQV